MNHSLISADRTTHLKIVVLALVAGIVVVTVGIAARYASAPPQPVVEESTTKR